MRYSPFTTKKVGNNILLEQKTIKFSHAAHHKTYVYLQAGIRISKAKFNKEKPLKGSEKEIIEKIHELRFNEDEPFVITGGHFSQLYVRNLGIFFNSLLDPRIPRSEDDWIKRQAIVLRTVALDLEVFRLAGKDYTTIVPVRRNLFTGFNFYTRPSDSLFAILYTLCALTDSAFIESIFPAKKMKTYTLQTKVAGNKLYKTYKETLIQLITTYYNDIIDPRTGLIKTTIFLASARDGIKRESSFYDNVIAWATIKLAKKLELYSITDKQLEDWRKKIIKNFWDEDEGLFLDDLSELSKRKKLFSADSFIVLSTGFLDYRKTNDRKYLEQMVTYIQRNKLSEPLPLPYSAFDLPNKLYWQVRHFAPNYMGTSIWSHWGMEYIKTLIYIGKFSDAKKHLAAYKKNIEVYGGYPELYDATGEILNVRLYHSVLHNGWVINYEQTKMLYNDLRIDH